MEKGRTKTMINGVEMKNGFFEEEVVEKALNPSGRGGRMVEVLDYKNPYVQSKTALALFRMALYSLELSLDKRQIEFTRFVPTELNIYAKCHFGFHTNTPGKSIYLARYIDQIQKTMEDRQNPTRSLDFLDILAKGGFI